MATPLRNVRVADDLWAAVQQRAARDGTTVSAVVVEALERYAANLPDDRDPEPVMPDPTYGCVLHLDRGEQCGPDCDRLTAAAR